MIKTFMYLIYLEFILILRHSQEWLYPIAFFLISVSLFPLALSPDPVFLQKYIPGCIWIIALFSSFLSIENIFTADLEDGALEQLLLCPYPLSLSIAAKLLAHWILFQGILLLITPLLGIAFQLPAEIILILCLSLLVGTPILTLLGTELAALTIGFGQRGVLLGILLLPLSIPVLIFGINIVQQAQAGLSTSGAIAFLAGLCFCSIAIFPMTIAVTLRLSFDD